MNERDGTGNATSDTPRTDNVEYKLSDPIYGLAGVKVLHDVVPADFARQLERELSAARSEKAHTLKDATLTDLEAAHDFTHSPRCSWWVDWNAGKKPGDCRPCSCVAEYQRALGGILRYLERGWYTDEMKVAEALRVAKIALGEAVDAHEAVDKQESELLDTDEKIRHYQFRTQRGMGMLPDGPGLFDQIITLAREGLAARSARTQTIERTLLEQSLPLLRGHVKGGPMVRAIESHLGSEYVNCPPTSPNGEQRE